MTDAQKRIELLELVILDCLDVIGNDADYDVIFDKLESVVGLNNEHLRSVAAKRRVKKPEPATA